MLKETTGQTIKYLREKNDLTREDLCQMIRLGGNSRTEDVQRLYKVENDKMELEESVIETLAQLFDVEVEDIKNGKEWITAKEAAKLVNCSITTIHARRKEGKLKNNKIGKSYYYLKSDVEDIKINKNKRANRKGKYGVLIKFDKKYFSKKLKELIGDDLNKKEIANKIGIGWSSWKDYTNENLERLPAKENLDKICDYFNVKPSYFKKNKTYDKKWIKLERATKLADCSESTIRRYINKNKIKSKKDGKFRLVNKDDVMRYKDEIKSNYDDFRKTEDDKIKELMNLIKSQSAKIKELNNKIEELESYHDKAEMKFEFFSDRITDLENLVEVMNENTNKNVEAEEEKGFFGRLFS